MKNISFVLLLLSVLTVSESQIFNSKEMGKTLEPMLEPLSTEDAESLMGAIFHCTMGNAKDLESVFTSKDEADQKKMMDRNLAKLDGLTAEEILNKCNPK